MATRKQAAREFVKTWSSPKKGREDADRQTFWNDLLQRVFEINNRLKKDCVKGAGNTPFFYITFIEY